MTIDLLRHQSALINMVRTHPEIPYVFLIGGFACGKLLPRGTQVQSPEGPVTIESRVVGTQIIGSDGQSHNVIGQSHQVDAEIYRIHFHNGDSIEACKDHLWVVNDTYDNKQKVLTTQQIIDGGAYRRYTIPMCAPVQFAKKELPVKPYTMGALIGDGSLLQTAAYQVVITTADVEILDRIKEDGYPLTWVQKYSFNLTGGIAKLIPEECKADSHHKRIPFDYLHSSVEDRIALLQGLMDTDGSADWKGRRAYPTYCTVSEGLKDDFIYLVESLGGKCTVSHLPSWYTDGAGVRHEASMKWVIRPTLPEGIPFFHLTRKQSRIDAQPYSGKGNIRWVERIEYVGKKEGYCITTDTPDHTYLTKDFIVTHNSFTDVSFMFFLYEQYRNYEKGVTFGIVGASIKLLTQTVLKDFEQFCTSANVPFKDNSQKGFVQVGNVRFVYLSGADPGGIYAHNFNGVICDELDELPPDRILALIKAIQERARVRVPRSSMMPERPPFVVFTTTAQGLGGTYQLIQYLKKVALPFAIIRARTADNPHNDPIMIENLSKLYTEEERRAFLEGEFVNLAAGRVYPMFDRKKHVYMPFDIPQNEQIYVGADFNYGFDNVCSIIEREGHIYVVMEHEVKFMGDAPRVLREQFPFNKIEFVPDASGKEVMQGLVEEFTNASVSVFWNSTNPGIGERVTAVNRLLAQDRLHVFSNCERIALGLEIQDYDDNGKPRKGKGPEAVDHILDCLSYAVWRVIHQVKGYESILEAIRAVHHHDELTHADLNHNGSWL